MSEGRKIKVAIMSYVMDGRQGKGSSLSAHRLIERLVRDPGLEVTLIHFEKNDDPLYKEAREIIMPQFKLPAGTRFFRTLAFFWKYRHEGFDVMHWFQSRVYPFFWFAPAKHLVISAHAGGDITSPGKFPLSRRVFNWTLKTFSYKVDAILCASNFGREEFLGAYGADPKRVYAVQYNGGAEEFHPLDRADARKMVAHLGIMEPYILDVSRLSVHKNVTALIQAYDRMRTAHRDRTEKLVIAGGPDNDTEAVYALAKGSKFSSDIHFIDYVEQKDMSTLYAGAELFAFPSLSEGFGMPLIEAFAAGTPIVTSNVASLPEVSGGAALLIDPTNPQELADAMYRLLTDIDLRERLIKKGLERCKEYTWDNGAKNIANIYKQIATKSN